MRLKLPFRVARGLAVVVSIVAAHALIFWLFNTMRIRMPELGPVFATLLVEPEPEAKAAPPGSEDAAEPVSAVAVEASVPAPVQDSGGR